MLPLLERATTTWLEFMILALSCFISFMRGDSIKAYHRYVNRELAVDRYESEQKILEEIYRKEVSKYAKKKKRL